MEHEVAYTGDILFALLWYVFFPYFLSFLFFFFYVEKREMVLRVRACLNFIWNYPPEMYGSIKILSTNSARRNTVGLRICFVTWLGVNDPLFFFFFLFLIPPNSK